MKKITRENYNLIYKIIAFIIIILIGLFSNAYVFAAETTTKKITVTKNWINDDESVRPTDIIINLKKSTSTLKIGIDVRTILINVAGGSSNITGILKADKSLYELAGSPTLNNISDSGEPVYVWYDSGIVYYYSKADNIYMNANSSEIFRELPNLTDITGLSGFNTTYVTNMFKLFYQSYSLIDLSPIANWDTGNVTTMRCAFGAGYTGPSGTVSPMSINSVSALTNWNTQKVTDMGLMFKGCLQLTDIDPISKWNVSNVANMNQMFMRCGISDATCIKDWDVVRVGGNYINASNGASTVGNFTQMFTHQEDIQNQQPRIVPFTNRDGTWNNGTYTASTEPLNDSAQTTTKLNDVDHYTNSDSNCTVTKNGNTWTYEFEVSNDESVWYVWEDTNNGKIDDKNGITDAYQESSNGINGLGGSEENAIRGIGVDSNNTATITNTNVMRKEITVTKLWANDSITLRPSNISDVNLHLKNGNTDIAKSNDDTTKWTLNNNVNEWIYTFIVYDDGNIADYTVVEDEIAHYNNSGIVGVIPDSTNPYKGTATITNTLRTYNIILNNKVTGNMADREKIFNFEINVYDWDGNLSPDSSTTVSLAHGQEFSISNIPEGYTYTITETDTDYTESYKIIKTDDNTVVIPETEGQTANGTLNENQTVIFINDMEESAPTGLFINNSSYVILGLIGFLGILLINKKKK